jgi:hypothetical protein
MSEPVKIEVIWDDRDIELRLMRAIAQLVDEAGSRNVGPPISPDALRRAGTWFAARCAGAANG